MKVNPKEVLKNYRDRVYRLALYDPLIELSRKTQTDRKGNDIEYDILGFLALLFFYENMIIRNKEVGVTELAEFFYEINKGKIDLDLEDFRKLARDIIDVFRPPSGQRRSKTFYNWESGQEETIYYSLLKASKSDLESNTQYYSLDEDGLELVFATREYYSEFQLSINQLLLRKQLEKGEFIGALRQIDEMRLAVENLKDRIFKIKHEVNRNIVSEKTLKRYKELVEDINRRLERENEEFGELETFVKDTKNAMEYEIKDERDKKAYELIIEIDRELNAVHGEHRKLLAESIALKGAALDAARESLYFMGIKSFNFKEEITSRLISTPLPLHSSRQLVKPFLYLGFYTSWSPSALFTEQPIREDKDEERINEFNLPVDEEVYDEYREITKKNFKRIMEIVLEMMKDESKIELEQLIIYIKEKHAHILDERSFYDFWIILHQNSPITMSTGEDKSAGLFEDMVELLKGKYKSLRVEETKGIIDINDRFQIRNMILKLERDDHGI